VALIPTPSHSYALFSLRATASSGCCPADRVECRYDSSNAAHLGSPGFESAANWAVFRIPRWIESCAEYFLDADRDGDVDIADAMQMAGRYLDESRILWHSSVRGTQSGTLARTSSV